MKMRSNDAASRARSTTPADHQYPYPWIRLRSAASSPFIYRRMIENVDPVARAGDVVAVYDRHGKFFGHGFYHDRSQIGLRILSYDPAPIDDSYFAGRISQALAWRRQLIGDDSATDTCRLIHAEGDGLSGLIAERYADWIAIEVFSLGIIKRIDLFKRLLSEQTGITRFVVRADEHIERIEGFHVSPALSDVPPRTITIQENGVRFRVDLQAGHKTGFFCDQRENRRRLASLCKGLDVLDCCCYTGGFGIYAMTLGQAASVAAVDLDEDAIELAKANAKLNQARVSLAHADAFSYLRQMQTNGRLFDAVVLDPPKFVPTRDDYREGSQKYADLNALGMTVLKPGGLLLTCSCSGLVGREDFLGMVKSAAARLRRPLQIVDVTGAGPDHPVMANCPESAYLKAVWARVM
ncbi:MAG TPA: class I SAM-dependent rRNA methyltransferase [Phycisphaerae bacterium]|nr:class I SAM-dependent rRNA methyltransferase [Phycisphaerae bacterium]